MKDSNIEKEVVVVPDVHGRAFWRDVKDFDCDIVFLGDYLDPYDFEDGVGFDIAIDMFAEIIDFAKSRDNVTLLYGNHDCGYAIDTEICQCRMDRYNFDKIRKMFIDNADMFSFAAEKTISGKRFLFTHSAIMSKWVKSHPDLFATTDISANAINSVYEYNTGSFVCAIGDVSPTRGGYSRCGSMIWSDLSEVVLDCISNTEDPLNDSGNFINVFGHSLFSLKKDTEPFAIGNRYCLDCRKNFYVGSDGSVRFLSNDKIVRSWQLDTIETY